MTVPTLNLESGSPQAMLRSVIQKIATGPELSKDISYDEARLAMDFVLRGKVDPVQAGIFLIALRMKRETDDENRGVLQALVDVTDRVIADVDDLVDVADPYDGYTRGLPASPFIPVVLAACGVPALSQGAESVGPKYGATHRKVLWSLGYQVDLSLSEAAERIANPECGWAYVDQRVFCPLLHNLVGLRSLIVKRSCITTVEVMLRPISGRRGTHLMTGYVHKPYPRIYSMLARHAGYSSAMFIRGVEGGVIPSLTQPSKLFHYCDAEPDREWRIEPGDVGVCAQARAVSLPEDLPPGREVSDDIAGMVDADAIAGAAADAGLAALRGEQGPVRDSLIYASAICLVHLKRFSSLPEAAQTVRGVLDSGAAYARLCN